MTSTNFRAHLLYYIKLCASFQNHGWIQTGVTVQKPSIRVKIGIFCPVWPWNLIDDLGKQQGTSSILHQALCIISKPWVNSKWSYSPKTLNSGQNRQIFVTCDLEIWQKTLKNNREPLLSCLKLCASFHSHQWIQTRVTVRKRPIWVQIDVFCPVWPWNWTEDLEKTIGHLVYATSSFVHHFVAIGEFKLELQSGNTQFGSKSTIFLAV